MPDDDETTDERYRREREERSELETPRLPLAPPRYATPASGVRSMTDRERRSGGVPYHVDPSGDLTGVGVPVIDRINARSKTISVNTGDILRRVGDVEKTAKDSQLAIVSLGTELAGLGGKVDTLVEESTHTRREREEREKRAETRAEAELTYRRNRTLQVISIVVPTIAALGALVAGIVAAVK